MAIICSFVHSKLLINLNYGLLLCIFYIYRGNDYVIRNLSLTAEVQHSYLINYIYLKRTSIQLWNFVLRSSISSIDIIVECQILPSIWHMRSDSIEFWMNFISNLNQNFPWELANGELILWAHHFHGIINACQMLSLFTMQIGTAELSRNKLVSGVHTTNFTEIFVNIL